MNPRQCFNFTKVREFVRKKGGLASLFGEGGIQPMKEKAQVLLKSAIFFVLSCFFLFLSEPSVAQGQEKVQLKEVRVQ